MNDQYANNLVTRAFGLLATIASALGISTQELVYMIFAAIGAVVTILSFVASRMDARAKRKLDERRTNLYATYLHKRTLRSDAQTDDAEQYVSLPGGESEA
jgi:hypothetical protein